MLAGRMKLRNFLVLAGLTVAGGITALVLTHEPSPDPPPAAAPPPAALPVKAPPQALLGETSGVVGAAPAVAGEDEVAAAVRGMAGRRLSSDKAKDVTSGRRYKVNLYQDSGFSQVNRAKVDLDRDDKWDEKWTFDGDRITRQIASADDEQYNQTRIFEAGAWRNSAP